MRYFLPLLLLTFVVHAASAQIRCVTEERYNALTNPEKALEQKKIFENWLQRKLIERMTPARGLRLQESAAEEYLVPVVVHVIHNGEPEGVGSNISSEQIQSQIEVLNEDFNRRNLDTINTPDIFKNVAASVGISFTLAKRDPEGFHTNGIVRIEHEKTRWDYYQDEEDIKELSYWPAEDYINIWVVSELTAGAIGFSTYPVTDLPGITSPNYNRLLDGIVIAHRYFGSSDVGTFDLDPTYDKGRSLTHEMGHYFGLRHIWGDENNCTADDYCDDTPLVESSHTNCPESSFTCGSENMFQNYMDYTPDACMNLFTQCQKERMLTTLLNSPRRLSLLTSPGKQPLPGYDLDLSVSQIVSPTKVVCAQLFAPEIRVGNTGSDPVEDFVVAYEIEGVATDTLTISEANLASETSMNVAFDPVTLEAGDYRFKAAIIEINGGDDMDVSNNTRALHFLVNTDYDFIPMAERFNRVFEWDNLAWSILNSDGKTEWDLSLVENGRENNIGAALKAYDYGQVGQEDWLVSPALDFSMTTSASLQFSLSYGHRPNRNDRLRVIASTDCGKTFPFILYDKKGEQLSGFNESLDEWKPAGAGDWRREYISLSELAGEKEVRIAFLFLNGNGNNIYIDDIEFFVSDKRPEDMAAIQENDFFIYPNPAENGQVAVALNLWERQDVEVVLVDPYGRILNRRKAYNALNQTFQLSLPAAVSGMYVVWIKGNTINKGRRVAVIR